MPGFEYGWLNREDAISSRQLPNIWVRLRREGGKAYGFASQDGKSWTATSRPFYDNDFAPKLYVGLAAASAPNGAYDAKSLTRFVNLSGLDGFAP